jgi:hypothetical protein
MVSCISTESKQATLFGFAIAPLLGGGYRYFLGRL